MYESYWKLRRPPFDCAPDVSFYSASRTHHGALLKLRYLIEHRKGAGLLIGAHGLGKTYLTHVLEAELDGVAGPVGRLVFPQMSAGELLSYVAAKLGAEPAHETAELRTDRILRLVEHRLESLAADGRHPLLIVDEAQVLGPEQLQMLHLLLNLAPEAAASFSLILVGSPELLPRIQRIGGLDERLAVRTTLRPLTAEETTAYVTRRLEASGAETPMFAPQVMQHIFELSAGVPRRINQLCDLALLVGYADQLPELTAVELEAAAEELASVALE